MENEAVTPDSIKTLVRDLKDLRDRVAKKETEMDEALAKFQKASDKMQEEIKAIQELRRELQGKKPESNSKSDRKSVSQSRSLRRSRSPHKSRSPRQTPPPRKLNNAVEHFAPSFSPSPTRSGGSSPEHRRNVDTRPYRERIMKPCYVCGKMGHLAKVCWFRPR